ncbi:hypothetical protein BASA81_011824, partial [Batrachochytrium salamandrivorans]
MQKNQIQKHHGKGKPAPSGALLTVSARMVRSSLVRKVARLLDTTPLASVAG